MIIKTLCSMVAVLFMAMPASATLYEDEWALTMDYDFNIIEGGGTGYDNGAWFEYPNYGWWNQWFYNDPFDPTRWKEIHVEFDLQVLDPSLDSYFEIVINWTTPEWSMLGLGQPPLPGDVPDLATEDLYIGRSDTFVEVFTLSQMPEHFEFDFTLWEYNPEWVSIDVWGYNFDVNGTIWHECVPAPGALALLGACCLITRRRRR
jgi:hypothetical protein